MVGQEKCEQERAVLGAGDEVVMRERIEATKIAKNVGDVFSRDFFSRGWRAGVRCRGEVVEGAMGSLIGVLGARTG